ncbi:MAG TPA: hypothetical protein VHC23_02170 [Jatrophihabitans sp.]|nr:hypothetical protein [Jatrophihabitans sp.]
MTGTRGHRHGPVPRAALAAIASVTVGLAGCTSGGSGGHTTPASSPAPTSRPLSTAIAPLPGTPPSSPAGLAAFLKQGFARLGSARVSFSTALSGNQLSGSGPVQIADGQVSALDVHATVSGIGAVHYVLAGGKPYAALPTPAAAGKPSVVLGSGSGDQLDRAAIGLQATKLLTSPATYRTLLAAADRLTLVGRTTVGAAPALHYRAPVRVDAVSSSDPVRFALAALDVSSLTVDLWVDGAGRPLRASAPAPDGRPSNVTFTDLNQPVSIAAPAADQVAK